MVEVWWYQEYMEGDQKASDRANCQEQLVLIVRGERRLRCIVCRLRRSNCHVVEGRCQSIKGLCNTRFTVWVSGVVDLQEHRCSMLTIGLYVFPGQESTETGV
ncbi:hypothetical protein TNCV_2907131 [Trichonephila clavipes]|nr:hypothetical protein TNCV_2907131 [Trichonephila clavipes]